MNWATKPIVTCLQNMNNEICHSSYVCIDLCSDPHCQSLNSRGILHVRLENSFVFLIMLCYHLLFAFASRLVSVQPLYCLSKVFPCKLKQFG